jgi:hypothetical protein
MSERPSIGVGMLGYKDAVRAYELVYGALGGE